MLPIGQSAQVDLVAIPEVEGQIGGVASASADQPDVDRMYNEAPALIGVAANRAPAAHAGEHQFVAPGASSSTAGGDDSLPVICCQW